MVDITEARNAVQADVTHALESQLPDGPGWVIDSNFPEWDISPMTNVDGTAVGVPWTWEGRNAGLLELAPTDRSVTVRGFTIVTEDPDVPGGLLCHRYVDWLPALQEAGLVVFTRPVVDIRTAYDDTDLREVPELADAFDRIENLRAEFELPED